MEPARRDADALWDYRHQKPSTPEKERLRLVVIRANDGSEHVICKQSKDLSVLDTIQAWIGLGDASFRNVCRVCSKLQLKDADTLSDLCRIALNYNAHHWFPGKKVDDDLQRKLQFSALKAQLTPLKASSAEVEFLDQLEQGRPVDVKSPVAKQLWYDAVSKNLTEVVKALLKNSIDPNMLIDDKPALCLAYLVGAYDVAEVLLGDKKTNLATKDAWQGTALMSACFGPGQSRAEAPVRHLIENGADVNAQDEYGRTALMLACQRGHTELVKELLKAGAFTSLKDREGHTARDYATNQETRALLA